MDYLSAKKIADNVSEQLNPHCIRIEIAGSIRRKKPDQIKDIEIVCIPKPYDSVGFIETGIATVINRWKKVKGDLGPQCKYTQRLLPDDTKIDIFFADPENWGYIFVIRTGSMEFSHKVAKTWVKMGYKGEAGYLTRSGKKIAVRDEIELFKILGIPMEYLDPTKRSL